VQLPEDTSRFDDICTSWSALMKTCKGLDHAIQACSVPGRHELLENLKIGLELCEKALNQVCNIYYCVLVSHTQTHSHTLYIYAHTHTQTHSHTHIYAHTHIHNTHTHTQYTHTHTQHTHICTTHNTQHTHTHTHIVFGE